MYTISYSLLRLRSETIYGKVVLMSTGRESTGKKFRTNLRALREMRGLTQAEMGARAGIAPASISHFETGQRVPALDSLVKLADALEVSVDTLLGRAPVESSAQVD